MLSTDFWKGAAERAVKSFFQTFVAVVTAAMGAEALGVSAGLLDVSWLDALSVAGLTAVLSVATSIGNADFTAGKNVTVKLDASLIDERFKEVQAEYEGKHVAE